jgi:hypothetical protein
MIRGEDKALKITITDSLGVLQDIDAMVNLIVYIYTVRFNTIHMKFSKVPIAGFTTLLRVSATEYTAILPNSITQVLVLSQLSAEIEIQETDVRFPDSIRRTKGSGLIISVEPTLITE